MFSPTTVSEPYRGQKSAHVFFTFFPSSSRGLKFSTDRLFCALHDLYMNSYSRHQSGAQNTSHFCDPFFSPCTSWSACKVVPHSFFMLELSQEFSIKCDWIPPSQGYQDTVKHQLFCSSLPWDTSVSTWWRSNSSFNLLITQKWTAFDLLKWVSRGTSKFRRETLACLYDPMDSWICKTKDETIL